MRYLIVILIFMTYVSPTGDDFIPKNIGDAVQLGCLVSGIKDNPSYAEVQVFVKTSKDSKGWDYKPVIARYTKEQGGVHKALRECVEWEERVSKRIEQDEHDPAQ